MSSILANAVDIELLDPLVVVKEDIHSPKANVLQDDIIEDIVTETLTTDSANIGETPAVRRSSRVPIMRVTLTKKEPSTQELLVSQVTVKVNSVYNKKSKVVWQPALVAEIQKRPPLWDKRLPPEERDPSLRQVLWLEVAPLFKCSVREIKTRWSQLVQRFKSIRMNFLRRFPEQSAIDAMDEAKLDELMSIMMPYHPWPYFKPLLFLLPTLSLCRNGTEDNAVHASCASTNDTKTSPESKVSNKTVTLSTPKRSRPLLEEQHEQNEANGKTASGSIVCKKLKRLDDDQGDLKSSSGRRRADDVCRTFGLHMGDLASFVPADLLSQYMSVVTAAMYYFMDSKVPEVRF